MKFLSFYRFLGLLFVWVFLQSCDGFSWLPKENADDDNESEKSITDGVKKTYRENGLLYSEVMFKNGKKHGLSKSYSKTGKLQFEIEYDSGRKHGLSKLFYENGKVRRETQYVKGEKNGFRKSYFTSGILSSSITYKNDLPANDLKEFLKNGNEKSSYEKLVIKEIDQLKSTGEYALKIKFSKNGKRAKYYVGKLVEGKYFDENKLREIPTKNGEAYLVFSPPPGTFVMEKLNIIGKLKTVRGNPLIVQKHFNLAIDGAF